MDAQVCAYPPAGVFGGYRYARDLLDLDPYSRGLHRPE